MLATHFQPRMICDCDTDKVSILGVRFKPRVKNYFVWITMRIFPVYDGILTQIDYC